MSTARAVALSLVALAAASLGGCSGGTDPSDDAFRVEGSWRWVSSVGGIAGETRTPASEGFEQRLELREDGTLRLHRDGELAVETTWEAPGGPGIGIPAIIEFGIPHPFGFASATPSLADGGATLVLRDPCCDGFERTFVRE